MFCTKCGEDVGKNNVCPKCGKVMSITYSQEQKRKIEANKTFLQFCENNKKIIGILSVFVICICVVFVFMKKDREVTSEEIEQLLLAKRANEVMVGEVMQNFTFDEIEVRSQEEKDGIRQVICDVSMSNEELAMEVQYSLKLREEGRKYHLMNYYITVIDDIKPLKGVTNKSLPREVLLQAICPEIEDLTSGMGLQATVMSQNTNLEQKYDQVVYQYDMKTNTLIETGTIQVDYRFNEDGVWEIEKVEKVNAEREWQLEGLWKFDIYTYYVELQIVRMDWENRIAEIQYRGSVWEGGGTVYSENIYFWEEGNDIWFQEFTIPNDSWYGSEHEILLIAKCDDMYYQVPVGVNQNLVDMPVGGKTEY